MSYKGIDTAARISADAAKKLKALGVSFAGRYLVPAGMGKDITAEEAKDALFHLNKPLDKGLPYGVDVPRAWGF